MKKLVVAFYDKKTKTWSDLITCPNLPTATRLAEQMVANEQSIYAKYPGDFDMYVLACTTEDDEGHLTIEVKAPFDYVCSFVDFAKSEVVPR